MEGKALILYVTYITNFSRASPDTSNQELTVIINSIRDTANHNYSSHNAINWVTCSPSLCRSIETVQVPWPATGGCPGKPMITSGKEKERCNFCRGIVILWVRSCGSHCKSEEAFVMDHRPAKERAKRWVHRSFCSRSWEQDGLLSMATLNTGIWPTAL